MAIFIPQILDTTLREGEQTPGVKFSYSQKLTIAKLLDRFGVDFIEVGNPSISKNDKKDITKIAKQKFKAQLICHSRAKKEDIDNVAETGVKWIGIFAGINEISLKYKYRKNKEEILKIVAESVEYAKKKGLSVRFTIEDATRTKLEDIKEVIKIAEQAGTDRISLADTLGVSTPLKTFEFIKEVKKVTTLPINVHFHNDFGMATANSITAVEAGANLIDVCVNTLGERNGIASLSRTVLALKLLCNANNKWNFKILPLLSKTVTKFSKIPIGSRTPVDGQNSFTHTAGLHINAVLRNKQTYEPIPAEMLGLKSKIYINEMASQDGFRYFLTKIKKIKMSEDKFIKMFKLLKEGKLKKYHGYFELK